MPKTILVACVLIFVGLLYFGLATDMFRKQEVHDFISCMAYGNPVMESYPRQCRDNDGNNYTEKIAQTEDGLVRVSAPLSGAIVTSPVTITGDARGFWFFEASFPISLIDESGTILAEHYATAQGDWMTENSVPFSSEIAFRVATTVKGFIVLKKDNPSGDPERDAEVRVPVSFSPNVSIPSTTKKCVIGGCSGQLCTDASKEPLVSTCEFREEYACYKEAVCEVQTVTNECGWTKTTAFNLCFDKATAEE